MILSNNTNTGKPRNNPVILEGERTKATARFNNDKEISKELRPKLLNAVVYLNYNERAGWGSGIILNAEKQNEGEETYAAYVLTAKHLLYIWADVKSTEKKPAEIATKEFLSKV